MFVIHKKSRMPGASSYEGPTWDQANIRHLYKKVYDNRREAEVLARVLSAWNPVGFDVYEMEQK